MSFPFSKLVILYLTTELDGRVESVVQLRVAGEPDVLLGRDRIQERVVGQVEPVLVGISQSDFFQHFFLRTYPFSSRGKLGSHT